jgi:hypothetical protein
MTTRAVGRSKNFRVMYVLQTAKKSWGRFNNYTTYYGNKGVEFSNGGYIFRKIFAEKSTYSEDIIEF